MDVGDGFENKYGCDKLIAVDFAVSVMDYEVRGNLVAVENEFD